VGGVISGNDAGGGPAAINTVAELRDGAGALTLKNRLLQTSLIRRGCLAAAEQQHASQRADAETVHTFLRLSQAVGLRPSV